MVTELILGVLLLQATGKAPSLAAVQTVQTSARDTSGDDPAASLKVKRVFVDNLGDDIISKEVQSMIVSSLVATKRFKVTENREKADAILKGTALEKTSQELHAYGEGTSVGAASGGSHAEISGSGGSVSGSAGGGFIARHMGTNDSSVNTETINEARIAIRLITPDGHVIWTTTQESKGAKYQGASADVADKCVKQLLRDVEKLEKTSGGPTATTPATPSPQSR